MSDKSGEQLQLGLGTVIQWVRLGLVAIVCDVVYGGKRTVCDNVPTVITALRVFDVVFLRASPATMREVGAKVCELAETFNHAD
jgi:hypothetical protein